MKLEVGKSYVNRLGEIRTIIKCTFEYGDRGYWDGVHWYTQAGRWVSDDTEFPEDLIAEAPEPAETCQFMPATKNDTHPNDGGPASAKSLREWYAGQSLAGCRANEMYGSLPAEKAAAFSLRDADALIAALKASRK